MRLDQCVRNAIPGQQQGGQPGGLGGDDQIPRFDVVVASVRRVCAGHQRRQIVGVQK